MKIGIEVQRLLRKRKFGIEISAHELISALYKLNTPHEIIVLVAKSNNNSSLTDHKDFKIKTVSGKLFFDFEQIFLPIAANNENLDILHCTGNTTPLYCKKPIVQTLHDVIFLDPIPTTDTWYQRYGNLYRRFIVPRVTKNSQAVITVSHYEKERIIKHLHLDENKIHVIHNGVNSRFKKSTNPENLKRTQLKYNLPHEFILFLGNTSTRKNPERVLEAYARYSHKAQKPLPLVTPGLPAEFVMNFLKQIGSIQTITNILSPGYIDQNDLVDLYSLSKLFLFPSLSEGFGMPILEAMACGVPVVTSNLSCIPEIAGNAAKLIDPYNIEEISSAINELLENPSLMHDLTERGTRQVERFRWSKVAEKTMEIYERVYSANSSNRLRGVPYD